MSAAIASALGYTGCGLPVLLIRCVARTDAREKVWTVPAERMKGGRTYRVPLCERMLEILKALPRGGELRVWWYASS